MVRKGVFGIAVAAVGLTGCMAPTVPHTLDTPVCPPVSVVAAGRIVESFRVEVHIEGREPHLLVPNIDMPGDEAVYVFGLQPSSSGVEVLVSESDYVRPLDVQISPRCRVTTVRPNNSSKPTPLRNAA